LLTNVIGVGAFDEAVTGLVRKRTPGSAAILIDEIRRKRVQRLRTVNA